MKILHEAPYSLLKTVANETRAFYCIAHQLVDEEYYQITKEMCADPGITTYLDSSVFELGKPQIQEMVDIVSEMFFDTIIIPDVFGSAEDTINYWIQYSALFRTISPKSKLMGVVHGEVKDDYERVIDMYERDVNCDIIGFPYLTPRESIINHYTKTKRIRKPIHLLGWNGVEHFDDENRLNIVSIDTSYPIAVAIDHKHVIADASNKPHWKMHHHTKDKTDLDLINRCFVEMTRFKTIIYDNYVLKNK